MHQLSRLRAILALATFLIHCDGFQHLFHTTVNRRWTGQRRARGPFIPNLKMGQPKGHSGDLPNRTEYWTNPGYRRLLHWVFKVGSLDATVEFFQKCFNMTVFRHEEFEKGCEATCNGPYGGAWSKTMMGLGTSEQDTFSLELTYNYGIDSYLRGNDLRYISMFRSAYSGPAEALSLDANGKVFLQTPDDHWIHLVDDASFNTTRWQYPFACISLHTAHLNNSIDFYTRSLGAQRITAIEDIQPLLVDPDAVKYGRAALFSWQSGDEMAIEKNSLLPSLPSVYVELVQLPDGRSVEHETGSGRLAIETEDAAPLYMAGRLEGSPVVGLEKVLHGPIKLEPHGEEVVIIQDPDGHEYCFVDARGFHTCTNVALREGGNKIDWQFRRSLENAALTKMDESPDFDFGPYIHRSSLLRIEDDLNCKLLSIEPAPSDVMLEVYARWCDVCLARKPVLQEVARRWHGRLDFMAVDGSSKRTRSHTAHAFSINADDDCKETCCVDDEEMKDASDQRPLSVQTYAQSMVDWAKLNGYPALFLLKHKDPSSPIFYDGDWDVNSISSWLESQ